MIPFRVAGSRPGIMPRIIATQPTLVLSGLKCLAELLLEQSEMLGRLPPEDGLDASSPMRLAPIDDRLSVSRTHLESLSVGAVLGCSW